MVKLAVVSVTSTQAQSLPTLSTASLAPGAKACAQPRVSDSPCTGGQTLLRLLCSLSLLLCVRPVSFHLLKATFWNHVLRVPSLAQLVSYTCGHPRTHTAASGSLPINSPPRARLPPGTPQLPAQCLAQSGFREWNRSQVLILAITCKKKKIGCRGREEIGPVACA